VRAGRQRLSKVLTTQEWLGLGVGVFGTLILFLLAAACHDFTLLSTDVPAGCSLRLGLAGIWALINLGHVMLVLIFEGFGRRRFAQALARLSLIGTPVAIVVSALIGPA